MPSPGAGQEKELLVDLNKTNATLGSGGGHAQGVHVLGKCDPEVSHGWLETRLGLPYISGTWLVLAHRFAVFFVLPPEAFACLFTR